MLNVTNFIYLKISWSEEIKTSVSGERQIRLFDEEGYAAVRKAQRSGEKTEKIVPLALLTVNHPGTYGGSFINSEIFATIIIAGVAYLAFSEMSLVSKFSGTK